MKKKNTLEILHIAFFKKTSACVNYVSFQNTLFNLSFSANIFLSLSLYFSSSPNALTCNKNFWFYRCLQTYIYCAVYNI